MLPRYTLYFVLAIVDVHVKVTSLSLTVATRFVGAVTTVTVAEEETVEVPSLTVQVYVVVCDGDAVGFGILALFNPVAGDHEYV